MIPEAAAEAAHRALRGTECYINKDDLRAALEAAAPHLLAEAWDKGYQAGVREEQPGWSKNPYR